MLILVPVIQQMEAMSDRLQLRNDEVHLHCHVVVGRAIFLNLGNPDQY